MQPFLKILYISARLSLLPLSIIYFVVIYLRNLIYDNNFIKPISFPAKIISIGNITTGGTGKTPFAIHLAEYFLNRNKRTGIISRGYKNNTHEMVLAFDGNEIKYNVNSTGDELYMIVNRLSKYRDKFFAIAYKDRIKAINFMITNYNPEIIILDDAFQNRKIKKSFDIVIRDNMSESILNKIILPAGNLREPFSSLKRADVIFDNNKFNNVETYTPNSLSFHYTSSGLYDNKGIKYNLEEMTDVILISGIAKNRSFTDYISTFEVNIKKTFQYKDHYKYTLKDIEIFEKSYNSGFVFITTEKDFVKLKTFSNFVDNYPVYYIRIDVNLNNDILDKLLNIENNT